MGVIEVELLPGCDPTQPGPDHDYVYVGDVGNDRFYKCSYCGRRSFMIGPRGSRRVIR